MKPTKSGPVCLAVLFAILLGACSSKKEAKTPGLEEAVNTAVDAYLYGYPLMTFDIARLQQTNVAVPDAEHAPMGQMIKMRSYPAVDNHCCAAPNADTLYTEAWLDVSKEPSILSIPDMGNRYYIIPMLDGYSEVFSVASPATTGLQGADLCHHWAGLDGHTAAWRDAGEVRHGNGMGSGTRVLHRHVGGLQGGACPAGQIFSRAAQFVWQAVHASTGASRC